MKIKTEPVSEVNKLVMDEIWTSRFGARLYVDGQAKVNWFNFYGREDVVFFNSLNNSLIGDRP